MNRDWWISIRLVCFVFQGSLLCDRPVSGKNRPVKIASQIFLLSLILVTNAIIKQRLPSSFDKLKFEKLNLAFVYYILRMQ